MLRRIYNAQSILHAGVHEVVWSLPHCSTIVCMQRRHSSGGRQNFVNWWCCSVSAYLSVLENWRNWSSLDQSQIVVDCSLFRGPFVPKISWNSFTAEWVILFNVSKRPLSPCQKSGKLILDPDPYLDFGSIPKSHLFVPDPRLIHRQSFTKIGPPLCK